MNVNPTTTLIPCFQTSTDEPRITLSTDTDTEVVAALALFIWRGSDGKMGFR